MSMACRNCGLNVALSPCWCTRCAGLPVQEIASMRHHTLIFRLSAATAVAGLVLAQAMPPALAQPAPPSGRPPRRASRPETRRSAPERLTQINGTVSFHTQDQDQWSPAAMNYPVAIRRRLLDRAERLGADRDFLQPHRAGRRDRTGRRHARPERAAGNGAAGRGLPAPARPGAERDLVGANATRA